jgi:hypothetical protein
MISRWWSGVGQPHVMDRALFLALPIALGGILGIPATCEEQPPTSVI